MDAERKVQDEVERLKGSPEIKQRSTNRTEREGQGSVSRVQETGSRLLHAPSNELGEVRERIAEATGG